MKGRTRTGVGYWFNWTLFSAVGWTLGMTVRQFLFGITGFATNLFLVGIVVGLAVGLTQYFALGQPGQRASVWVLAGVAGWAAGWGLGWGLGWELLGSQGFKGIFGTVGAVGGLASGTIQWWGLRQEVSAAGWWVLASSVGWAIGLALSATVVGGPLGWIVAGAMSGAITGLVLVWLYRPSTSSAAGDNGKIFSRG